MPTNHLLQEERDRATFSVEEMINFVDGGAERTQRRREIEGWILNDPVWEHEPLEFLSREQQYAVQLRKGAMATRLMEERDIDDPYEKFYVKRMTTGRLGCALDLHTVMFVPAILGQGSDEQVERWLQPALEYRIVGTYAQTELGHGTFLRGIETTATYDPATEEFVLHSPTVTAIKWWPGSLGKTVNHAVVMAQLHSLGQCHGAHLFFVRLRDQDTHEPAPGVTLGDIGPKFGYGPIDNGFMRLRQVRVPRDHLLMRHAEVTPDGRYVRRAQAEGSGAKLSYGTMLMVRAVIVGDAARGLSEAVTIAARYSCVRLQGELGPPGCGETRVIEYRTQQQKLLPLLSWAFAFYFAGEHLREAYFEVAAEVGAGQLGRLPELHALSSCLKALCTETAAAGVEECRKACGGHGYSLASGLPQIYVTAAPACTYEGENTVLYLQTARYLLKCHEAVQQPGAADLPPSVAYLSRGAALKDPPSGPGAVDDLDWLVSVHEDRARRMLSRVGAEFARLTKERGVQWPDAFNQLSIRLVRVVKAHAEQYIVGDFVSVIKSASPTLRPVLNRLAALLALNNIVEHSGDFLQTDAICHQALERCEAAAESCLAALRPDLVPLVDSFDLPDRVLNSVLGRYDGQVYDNLFQWAQRAPFNRREVLDTFLSTLRPLQTGEPLPPLSKL